MVKWLPMHNRFSGVSRGIADYADAENYLSIIQKTLPLKDRTIPC